MIEISDEKNAHRTTFYVNRQKEKKIMLTSVKCHQSGGQKFLCDRMRYHPQIQFLCAILNSRINDKENLNQFGD